MIQYKKKIAFSFYQIRCCTTELYKLIIKKIKKLVIIIGKYYYYYYENCILVYSSNIISQNTLQKSNIYIIYTFLLLL